MIKKQLQWNKVKESEATIHENHKLDKMTTDNNNDCVRRPTTDSNNDCVRRPTTDNNNDCVKSQIKKGRHSFWDPKPSCN